MDLGEEKVVMGIGTGVILVGAWVVTALMPALAPSFTTITGALLGLYTVFCGGHLTNKWIETKQGSGGDAPAETEQDVTMTDEDTVIADKARQA